MPDPQVSLEEENPAPSEPASKKKLWLAIVLVVALCAGGFFVWVSSSSSQQPPSENQIEATLPLETFVVNLKGGDRAYLRIGITLALAHAPDKKQEPTPIPMVRDTILSVLSSSQPDQLLQAEGKRQLKNAILDALNQRAPELGVKDVYFTEFLVQM